MARKRKQPPANGDEGDGGGGARRVRFSNEVDVSAAAAPDVAQPGPMEDGDDEEDNPRQGDRVGVALDDGVAQEPLDDDDEEEAAPSRMVEEVAGEEDETGHKFDETGVPLEPFNLREEREVGHFDANGNFVWAREAEEPDAWIAGLEEAGASAAEASETAIVVAAAAQSRSRARRDEEDRRSDALAEFSVQELRVKLVALLQPKETPLKALRRLGGGSGASSASRGRGGRGRGRGGNGSSGGGRGGAAAAAVGEAERVIPGQKEAFSRVTELADALLRRGQVDIYQQEREELEKLIAAEPPQVSGDWNRINAQARAAADAAAARGGGNYFAGIGVTEDESNGASSGMAAGGESGGLQFEYRGEDGQVHGPFAATQIKAWLSAGYFQGPQAVMMRKVGGEVGASAGSKTAAIAPAKSEADELMDDLNDDDEVETAGSAASAAGAEDWVSSETIDFSAM